MNYPSYLMHFNRNHGKKNGQFVSGDGDGDGVTNDRHNYKDNRSGQTKGSVVITTPSGRKTLTNTGGTARVGRVGNITKAGSSNKSLVGRVDASKATRGTGTESNHSGRVMGTGGVQWQKRDARTSGGKSSHKEWHDDAKVQKINQISTKWAATTRIADKVKNGSYTRGTPTDTKNYREEATYDKTKRMHQYGDEGIGGMKDYTEDRIANKTVTRGTGTESQKSGQDIDMAKEDRMYQKETIWAGMKSVDRISSSNVSTLSNDVVTVGMRTIDSDVYADIMKKRI